MSATTEQADNHKETNHNIIMSIINSSNVDYSIINVLEDVQALTRDLLHTINTNPEFVSTDKYNTLINDLCAACQQIRTDL